MKLKLVYFGTPYFSARFLEKILTDVAINQLIDTKLVVTQPDRPVGRKQILTPTPVKLIARKYQIPISNFQTNFIPSKAGQISNFKFPNFDLALLYAYGEIIPKELLSIPKYGFLNIHPSLLPKYRGASPIAYPLILGDKKTGVTIIKMDEKIDHGPIIAQGELPILPTDRRPDLEVKLTDLAFKIFKKLIGEDTFFARRGISSPAFSRGKGTQRREKNGIKLLREQNHKLATFTRLLKKSDGFVPLTILKKALRGLPANKTPKINSRKIPYLIRAGIKKSGSFKKEFLPTIIKEYYQKNPNSPITDCQLPATLFNLFRGLYPWPGIWTILPNGKRLKITNLKLLNFKNFSTLKLEKVQLEGKKEVEFKQFNIASNKNTCLFPLPPSSG